MKDYRLLTDRPAAPDIAGWLNGSYGLGNGYFGISVFGGVERERLQISEKTLYNRGSSYYPLASMGLESFGDIYIDSPFDFTTTTRYRHTLSLDRGLSLVEYSFAGTDFRRTCFVSYPDRVMVWRMTAEGAFGIHCNIHPELSALRESYFEEGDGRRRSGSVTLDENRFLMRGESVYYRIVYEGQLLVRSEGGTQYAQDGVIRIDGARSVTLLFSVGTNYRMDSHTFTAPDPEKLIGAPDPHDEVTACLDAAAALDYETLLARHIADHSALFDRASVDLGGLPDDRTTAALIRSVRAGQDEPYLCELAYQMGRYMTIASSRDGATPSHLQAIWNAYTIAPWTCGLWYNVNEQMNYWPTFSSNLTELFDCYAAFNEARMEAAQDMASNCIRRYNPERHEEGRGKDGWIVGTGNSVYYVGEPGGHSGPGTGGFTTAAYIDLFRYTQDIGLLRRVVYPALEGMARFYLKSVRKIDGKYLTFPSYSPEQIHHGKYYETAGCAFDQQMIYENNAALVSLYDRYKEQLPDADAALVEEVRAQLDLYDPVLIGDSGQIKEYREENFYGEIGDDPHHRHMSQLVGAYPGTVINEETPAWLDAVARTLELRGIDHDTTSWTFAHKLCIAARASGGEVAYRVLSLMLSRYVFDNLWGSHCNRMVEGSRMIFQCDSVFGLTAGMTEMLLQSHGASILLLPALPAAWKDGSFTGLRARGAFVLDAAWQDGTIRHLRILSERGLPCRLRFDGAASATVRCEGRAVPCTRTDDAVSFDTASGGIYEISSAAPAAVRTPMPAWSAKTVGTQICVEYSAEPGTCYRLLIARDSEPRYAELSLGGSGRDQIDFPAQAHACTVVLQAQKEGCTAVRTPGIRLLHPNR